MALRTAIFGCVWLLSAFAMADGTPVADGRAVVMCGNVRFTVLTSRLIRMEWSGDGVFEDNATLFAVNRRMNLADYTVKRSKRQVVITAEYLTLKYRFNEGFFGNQSCRGIQCGRRTRRVDSVEP